MMKIKGYTLNLLSTLLLFTITSTPDVCAHESEKVLHDCIQFVNIQVEAISQIQKKLDSFDLLLHMYYEEMSLYEHARLYQEKIGKGKLVFHHEALPNLKVELSTNLQTLLEQIQDSGYAISQDQFHRLQSSFENLQYLMIKLDAYCLKLASHIEKKQYLKEPELSTARGILAKCEVLFEDFDNEKWKCMNEISQIHAKRGLPGKGFPYTESIQRSKNLLAKTKPIVSSIKRKDQKNLAVQVRELEEELAQSKAFMSTPSAFPHVTTLAKFQQLTYYADSVLSYAQSYMDNRYLQGLSTSKEKEYYLINDHLIPLLSDPRDGMIAIYNAICEESHSKRLPMVNETKWFLPSEYMPKEPAPDPKIYTFDQQTEPTHLILLVDISGSMNRQDKLPLMKEACSKVLSHLRPSDQISLVTFAGTAEVIADSYSITEKDRLKEMLLNVNCKGESQSNEGVMLAYKLGRMYQGTATKQRVIMVTDGGFNINQSLLRLIESQSFVNIPMSVLYVGSEHHDMERRLQKLAYVGGGNFGHARAELFVPYLLIEAGAELTE